MCSPSTYLGSLFSSLSLSPPSLTRIGMSTLRHEVSGKPSRGAQTSRQSTSFSSRLVVHLGTAFIVDKSICVAATRVGTTQAALPSLCGLAEERSYSRRLPSLTQPPRYSLMVMSPRRTTYVQKIIVLQFHSIV
jgi:hypothetical protein